MAVLTPSPSLPLHPSRDTHPTSRLPTRLLSPVNSTLLRGLERPLKLHFAGPTPPRHGRDTRGGAERGAAPPAQKCEELPLSKMAPAAVVRERSRAPFP